MPGKRHPWSRTGALFPLCYRAINPNLILKLIAMATNYEQQDLKPLIAVEVNKGRQRYHGAMLAGGGIEAQGDVLPHTTI